MQDKAHHASYRAGVTLRIVTAVVIEAGAAASYALGILRSENLVAVSISVAFIAAMSLPFYFVMKSAIGSGRAQIPSLADRFFVLLGYSGVIYALGGIEATYIAPVYIILMVYYVVATDRKMPYVTATMSMACFALVVLLDYAGALPHLGVIPGYNAPIGNQVAILAVTSLMLYVSAFISSYVARIIDRGRAELQERNIALEKAKDQAFASDRLKSEFLAHMSHELRTPLQHIIGFTQLVLEDSGDHLGPSQSEQLGDVVNSGRHLLSLINEVLDFSRIESGKVELARDTIDFGALLKGSLTVVEDSARRQDVQVKLALGDLPGHIRADEKKLRQVLYNLLSNAVKFTPSGGTVVLDARTTGPSHLLVSVSDTGIGLAEKDLERVFLPFESIHREHRVKYPGTGLGLSLCKKYVELQGGRIWAESPGEDRGSTFRFTIPLL